MNHTPWWLTAAGAAALAGCDPTPVERPATQPTRRIVSASHNLVAIRDPETGATVYIVSGHAALAVLPAAAHAAPATPPR